MKTYQENVKALISKLNASFGFKFYLEEMANFGRPFTILREGTGYCLDIQYSESGFGTTDLGLFGPSPKVPKPTDQLPAIAIVTETWDDWYPQIKDTNVEFCQRIPIPFPQSHTKEVWHTCGCAHTIHTHTRVIVEC